MKCELNCMHDRSHSTKEQELQGTRRTFIDPRRSVKKGQRVAASFCAPCIVASHASFNERASGRVSAAAL